MQNFNEKVRIVIANDGVEKTVKAALDLSPGETIHEEKPLFVAAHWDCEHMKCSQCFQESLIMCKKCHVFPLCMDCPTHDTYDCEYFSENGPGSKITKDFLVKNYGIFGILKFLLLLENDLTRKACEPIVNKAISVHIDDYRNDENWSEQEVNVVNPLISSGVLETFKNSGHELNADYLHQLWIAIDSYAFELTNKEGDSLKGLYMGAAHLPHHCVPNTVIALDDEYNMKIYAAVAMKADDTLYTSYTNPLMGTSQRQHHLRISRHFDCTCSRCLDPTEMGTHMSSLRCKSCPNGWAVCDLGNSKNWICSTCRAVIDSSTVRQLLADATEAMTDAEGDIRIYERLLAQYSEHFHPNHFVLLDLKQNIAMILRTILLDTSFNPGVKVLARKVQLCEEILPVVRAVLPGISKLYAVALFEYMLSFVELAELEYKSASISDQEYREKLQKAKTIAKEAKDLLEFEPENSPEGDMKQRLIIQEKYMEEYLTELQTK